ncbi:hypothetical protein [Nocardiopsis sp. CNT312]|uniref:hypothetical protein n=1 Tax=Nocardiopsis sp. CNT312 TaxID=1137268 RepID=UPI00048B0973|nr:hypothetical protein [Nocardiopsis sp. CNT312]
MRADADRDLPGLAGRALEAFEESAQRRRDRDALIDDAFAALLDLYRATTRPERRSPAGRDFAGRLAGLLASGSNPDRLGLYVVRSQTAAEHGRHEGYRPACWRRSMLQLLGEEFVDWEVFLRPGDLEALPRIDEALAEAAADTRADGDVPAWVPDSHWWWWEPARLRGESAPGDSGPLDTVAGA